MIETIRQGLKEDAYIVLISKLCQWFSIPHRTVYYKPTKAAPKIKPKLAEPINAMIEESPSVAMATNERWAAGWCRIWAGWMGHPGSGDRQPYA